MLVNQAVASRVLSPLINHDAASVGIVTLSGPRSSPVGREPHQPPRRSVFVWCRWFPQRSLRQPSAEESSTAALDGLDFGHVNGAAAEAGRQVAAVEVEALGGLDRAQVGARGAADATDRLAEGTVLLDAAAVRAEAGVRVAGQRARGRGRVRLRRVVDAG